MSILPNTILPNTYLAQYLHVVPHGANVWRQLGQSVVGCTQTHEVGVVLYAVRQVVQVVVREAQGGEGGQLAEFFGKFPHAVVIQIEHLRLGDRYRSEI